MLKNKKTLTVTILIAVAFLLPIFVTDGYIQRVLTMVALDSIVVLSVNMIVGFCGLLDFGRAAFVGLGGYFSAIMMMRLHVPYILAFIGAGLFCALIGAVLGSLCRNSSFDYLTLITIGFSEICRLVFLNWVPVTNGALGITKVPSPNFFGFKVSGNLKYYYFAIILLIICYILVRRIINSKLGRSFEAIRDNDIAASYAGINVPNYKVLCFSVASFFTGIAGSALVHYGQYASPYNYTIDESLIFLQMAILGGLGSLPGCIIGAAILVIAPEMSRTFYEYRLMIIGLMMVIMMIWAPNGLLGKNGIGDKLVELFRKKEKKSIGGEIK